MNDNKQRDFNPEDQKILLISTVGGSSDPILRSIKCWKPKKVIFICSKKSKESFEKEFIDSKTLDKSKTNTTSLVLYKENDNSLTLKKHGLKKPIHKISGDDIEFIELDNEEEIDKVANQIRRKITPQHKKWIKNSEAAHSSILDITGGTKAMSAGLALSAYNWEKYQFSYISGSDRDKEGLGIVKAGTEKQISSKNPLEVYGYQIVESAILLFDSHHYSEAYNKINTASKTIKNQPMKNEFMALESFFKFYDLWDKFNHKKAKNCLERFSGSNLNNLKTALKDYGSVEFDLEKHIESFKKYIEKLDIRQSKNPLFFIFDLIVNAIRKSEQNCFDDAVARLYRAVEAMSQYRLQEKHSIETAKCPIDELSPSLKNKYSCNISSLNNNSLKTVKLPLQDSYVLLAYKKDPLGNKFKELKLDQEKSPLSVRNNSILAHGFQTITETNFNQLLEKTKKLFNCLKENHKDKTEELFLSFDKTDEAPFFPKLKKNS